MGDCCVGGRSVSSERRKHYSALAHQEGRFKSMTSEMDLVDYSRAFWVEQKPGAHFLTWCIVS